MSGDGGTNQELASVEKNSAFFSDNERYASNVAKLDTYKNISLAVNKSISGIARLLDVGNGGVFDYDPSLAGEVVGVDLFLDESSGETLPANVTLRRGDALNLDEEDASYDGVLMMFVLHHLIARDVAGTIANVRRAIAESRRVLRPGGKFVIAESCVSRRAFVVEKPLFPLLRIVAATRLMKHPATLQLPPELIAEIVREHFDSVEVTPIPIGRLILQFGHRWPTALTPARPFLFMAS